MKKATRESARCCLVLAVLIGWRAALSAAEPPGAGELHLGEVLSEHLDLLHVAIDLTVTDRKGRPVTDLDPADFELFRNGVRQEILSFTAPPDLFDEAGRRDGSAGPRRHIVVYVDDLRLVPSRRRFLLRRTQDFLADRLRQGDRVSLVAFDGALAFLLSASSDEERVKAALARAGSRPGMARLELEGRRLQQALDEGVGMATLGPQIESYTERLHADVLRSLAGLGAAVRTLAELGAPTVVLYLCGELPARPGESFADPGSAGAGRGVVVRRRPGDIDDPATQGISLPSVQVVVSRPSPGRHAAPSHGAGSTALLLDPLITAAHRAGVVFYPVRSSPSSRPDQQSPLRLLAESTGGDMMPYGRFDVALGKLSQRLDAAYTLGFQVSPQHVARSPSPTERIEVRVGRKGLRVHYPKAYFEAPGSLASAPSAMASGVKQPVAGSLVKTEPEMPNSVPSGQDRRASTAFPGGI